MAKRKLLDFSRVGKSASKKNINTVGKVIAGGLVGEMLPSIFQRITGINSAGVAGNAVSGAVSTVVLLAMNQKEMAAGVIATKAVKAVIAYGNPVAARITGVPIALPSTNDGIQTMNPMPVYTTDTTGDDLPAGAEMLTLPSGRQIPAITREPETVVNYDTGGRTTTTTVEDFLTEQQVSNLDDRFSSDVASMLADSIIDETMGM